MRDYATVAPQFWSGETWRALRRAGPNALLVAMYLLTTPHSNAFGFYYMPLMYLAHDLNMSVGEAAEAMEYCVKSGFCEYDFDADVVWVRNMARFQIGEKISPKDNRAAWVAREWAKLPKCDLLAEFRAQYAEAYGMADSPSATVAEGEGEAPRKPLAESTESPSPSPLGSPSATGAEGEGEAPPPEHEHEQDIKNINIYTGETVNERRARSPERRKEGEEDAPAHGSPDDPGMEFVELRELYSRLMRPEGPRAGFAEYKQIKAARQWPGLSRIAADISARKEAGTWSPGFEIGLGRYLREQTWLAPVTGRAQAAASAPTEYQRRQQESRELARARLAMRESEREAKNGTRSIAS